MSRALAASCRAGPSLALALPLALALGGVSCDRAAPAGTALASAAAPDANAPVTVKVATARVEPWPLVLDVSGSLEVDERSTLGAEVAGRAVELLVDVGSIVQAGDAVARIDDKDYRLAVEQAHGLVREARARVGLPLAGDDDEVDPEKTAQVRLARAVNAETGAKLARAVTLRDKDIIGEAEFEEADAAAKVAEEQVQTAVQLVASLSAQLQQRRVELARAEVELTRTSILAPYDGVVLRRRVGRGDFLTPGTPVVDVVRMHPLRLIAEVREEDATRVRAGQALRFTLEGASTVHEVTVSRLPPELDRASRSLFIESAVPNVAEDGSYPLRAGSFARVAVVIDADATALAVPKAALRSFAGVDRLVTVENGVAKEVLIKVGRREAAKIEILEGIAAGTRVIIDPGSLATGRAVRETD